MIPTFQIIQISPMENSWLEMHFLLLRSLNKINPLSMHIFLQQTGKYLNKLSHYKVKNPNKIMIGLITANASKY